jgi:glycosyl transferase family 25
MIDDHSIGIYLINLDRAPERFARMDTLLSALDLPFRRIAAVDGKAILPQAMSEIVRAAPGHEPTPEQVGCFLSHRLAWEAIACGSARYGLILEDDIVFAKNFAALLPRIPLADGADIIRLEGWPGSVWTKPPVKKLDLGYALYRLDWDTCGTAAYLISKKCAARLLAAARYYTLPIDNMLFNRMSPLYTGLTTFAAAPAACYQHAFWDGAAQGGGYLASSIVPVIPTHREPSRKSRGARILAEMRRGAKRLDLLLAGQRRLLIKLHPVGPLVIDEGSHLGLSAHTKQHQAKTRRAPQK